MGGEKVTTLNLEVVEADAERDLAARQGRRARPEGGLVLIRNAVKGRSLSMATIDAEAATAPTPARSTSTTPCSASSPTSPVMHQVVTAQLAARRAGTQSTKTRAEVRGGGAKPWRQKGTGRARQGSTRVAALGRRWRGPRPEAPLLRAADPQEDDPAGPALGPVRPGRRGQVVVVDAWDFDAPKTKDAVAALERPRRSSGKVARRVGRDDDDGVEVASATSPTSTCCCAGELNAYDVLCTTGSSSRREPRLPGGAEPGPRRSPPPRPTPRPTPTPTEDESMKDPRDVILKPVVSEKSYALLDDGVYTFIVHPDANKPEIRDAVEAIFNVQVTKVNTLNRKGKRKRNRRTVTFGKRPDTKRAIVTLAAGDRIDLFEG